VTVSVRESGFIGITEKSKSPEFVFGERP